MKTIFRNNFLALTILIVLNTACKKKEIQGPKGEQGDPGIGGNINLLNSEIVLVSATQWTSVASPNSWITNFKSALITKKIVESGSVSVFFEENNAWKKLPYTVSDNNLQFAFSEGVIHLTYSNFHNLLPEKPLSANYRLVILAESAKTSQPNSGQGLVSEPQIINQ